jgi:peptidoglycan hydrolase-like protein with peptidoglycan-binding domain
MRKKKFNIVMAFSIAIFALSTVFILITPSVTKAQTTGDNADLLNSIRVMFNESISRLANEIQDLRREVDVLRSEVQQQQTGGGSPFNTQASPPTQQIEPMLNILRSGDTGNEVRRLQEVLIQLGYSIPAGITGNFFAQTQEALRRVQRENNIPVTGEFDEATRAIVSNLLSFRTRYSPPPNTVVPNTPPPQPVRQEVSQPNSTQPVITPGLRLDAPFDGLQTTAGATVQIIWSTTYAPAGAKVTFHIKNRIYGVRQPVYETSDLSGEYMWTTPNNMPSDNDLTAELVYEQANGQVVSLASRTVMVSLIGSTLPTDTTTTSTNTTTTSTTNTSGDTNYDQYAAFYKGTAFTTCMAEFPSTISLISGWVDSGLLRHQFPWGEITGGAAYKVAECEAGQFDDHNYSTYTDCTANTSESSCQTNTACAWFDTFCGMAGYNPGSGGGDYGYCTAYSSSDSCTAATNCYWYEASNSGNSYCYYDSGVGSGGGGDCTYNSNDTMCTAQAGCQWFTTSTGSYCNGDDHVPGAGGNSTSQMYSCFYPNATINGTPPGYTVWCEYDYVNCHEGSPSGATVPLDGLSLGAPSSCESGWNGSSQESGKFLAAVSAAFSSLLKSLQFIFGF